MDTSPALPTHRMALDVGAVDGRPMKFAIAVCVCAGLSVYLIARMRYRELTWSEYLTRMKEIR